MDCADIVSYATAQELVRGLKAFELSEIGSPSWQHQHATVEKLNMQAHQNLAYGREEFISTLLDDEGKWDIVVAELISAFIFRQTCWPKIVAAFCLRGGSSGDRDLLGVPLPPVVAALNYYRDTESTSQPDGTLEEFRSRASIFFVTILYHEAVLADLVGARIIDQLPRTNYHEELVSWAAERLLSLATSSHSFVDTNLPVFAPIKHELDAICSKLKLKNSDVPCYAADLPTMIYDRKNKDFNNTVAPAEGISLPTQFYLHDISISYRTSLVALTIARGLCTQDLNLAAAYRLQTTHILNLLALCLTATDSPWQRRRILSATNDSASEYQYYDGNTWRDYKAASERHFMITVYEGQCWIALIGLCMGVHSTSTFKRITPSEIAILENVKGRISESKCDQVPYLRELRTVLERLSVAQAQQQLQQGGQTGYNNSSQFEQLQNSRKRISYALGESANENDTSGFLTAPADIALYAPGSVLVQTVSSLEQGIRSGVTRWAKANDSAAINGEPHRQKDEYALLAVHLLRTLIAAQPKNIVMGLNAAIDAAPSVFPLCAVCRDIAKSRCSRCHSVWYCGRNCQAQHWKSGHRTQCAKLAENLEKSEKAKNEIRTTNSEVEKIMKEQLRESRPKESKQEKKEEKDDESNAKEQDAKPYLATKTKEDTINSKSHSIKENEESPKLIPVQAEKQQDVDFFEEVD